MEPISTTTALAIASVVNSLANIFNIVRGSRQPKPKDQLEHQKALQVRQNNFQVAQQLRQEEFQKQLTAAQTLAQVELSKMQMEFQSEQQWERLQFQANESQLQREFQTQQAHLRFEEQVELTRKHKETMLALRDEDENYKQYPLRLPRSKIFELYKDHYENSETIPLLVILSTPNIDFDKYARSGSEQFPAIEQFLTHEIERLLAPFTEKRLIEIQSGIWDTKLHRGRAAVSSLFTTFKTIPTLILETNVEGQFLYFNVGFWNGVSDQYEYRELERFDVRIMLAEYARDGARNWGEKARKDYVERGKSPDDLLSIGGIHEKNWLVWVNEQAENEYKIDWSRQWPYSYTAYHYERFTSDLASYHALIIGWFADVLQLKIRQRVPILPLLLPELFRTRNVDESLFEKIISGYLATYQHLETEISELLPFLYLDLADVIARFSNQKLLKDTLIHSLRIWAKNRGLEMEESKLMNIVINNSAIADWEYIRRLRNELRHLGIHEDLAVIDERIEYLSELIVIQSDL